MIRISEYRGEDLRRLLAEQFGAHYSLSGVYALPHQANGWVMPAANTEAMAAQLADLSAQLDADVHAALVLDGARGIRPQR